MKKWLKKLRKKTKKPENTKRVLIVRVGNDAYPASPDDIREVQQELAVVAASDVDTLVTRHFVEMEWVDVPIIPSEPPRVVSSVVREEVPCPSTMENHPFNDDDSTTAISSGYSQAMYTMPEQMTFDLQDMQGNTYTYATVGTGQVLQYSSRQCGCGINEVCDRCQAIANDSYRAIANDSYRDVEPKKKRKGFVGKFFKS